MKVWLVTRHEGAVAWARAAGLRWDEHVSHLADVRAVEAGDRVFGTVPLHLAAQLCAAGAEYWHLEIRVDENARGREHSACALAAMNCRFVRFDVKTIRTWAT